MKRVIVLLFICTSAFADQESIATKHTRIEQLKQLITDVNSEISRCQQTQKKWKIATAIGAAGTIATGTAATIQGVQIHKAKQEKDAPDTTNQKQDNK